MNFTRIKKILLAEYTANGGTNTQEFVRGMTYLEDYIESGRNDHGLNAYVDEQLFLQKKNDELQAKVEELNKILKHKQSIINQYREMNKEERRKFRASEELVKMEMVYSRMVVELEEKYKRKRFKNKPMDGSETKSAKPHGRKIYKSQI